MWDDGDTQWRPAGCPAGEGRGANRGGRAGGAGSGPWTKPTAAAARSPGRAHSIVSLQECPGIRAGVAGGPPRSVLKSPTGTRKGFPGHQDPQPPLRIAFLTPRVRGAPGTKTTKQGPPWSPICKERGGARSAFLESLEAPPSHRPRLSTHPPPAPAQEATGSEPRAAGSRRGPAKGAVSRDRPHRKVLASGCGSLQASGSEMTFGSTPHSSGLWEAKDSL